MSKKTTPGIWPFVDHEDRVSASKVISEYISKNKPKNWSGPYLCSETMAETKAAIEKLDKE